MTIQEEEQRMMEIQEEEEEEQRMIMIMTIQEEGLRTLLQLKSFQMQHKVLHQPLLNFKQM